MDHSLGSDKQDLDITGLDVQAVSQDALEIELALQANRAILENQNRLDSRLLEKEDSKLRDLQSKLSKLESKSSGHPSAAIRSLQSQIKESNIVRAEIRQRILGRENEGPGRPQKNETQRDFLLRTGAITPFDQPGLPSGIETPHHLPLQFMPKLTYLPKRVDWPQKRRKLRNISNLGPTSRTEVAVDLRVSGFEDDYEEISSALDRPRRVTASYTNENPDRLSTEHEGDQEKGNAEEGKKKEAEASSEESNAPSSEDIDPEDILDSYTTDSSLAEAKTARSRKVAVKKKGTDHDQADDGNEQVFQDRLKRWVSSRKKHRKESGSEGSDNGDTAEWHLAHPFFEDLVFEDQSFRLPGDIAQSLFEYQKTGVKWLWELYKQRTGGILGDEMGLGKTVQMISFISGLHYTRKLDRPALVIAPATVLRQWANEFRKWWPPMRVSILHSTGSGMLSVKDEDEIEKCMSEENGNLLFNGKKRGSDRKASTAARQIVKRVVERGHVLITTYAGLQIHGDILLPVEWECAVLDEGHRIRNPDAAISLRCKQIKSATRIILSGTPIQNSLVVWHSLTQAVIYLKNGLTFVKLRHGIQLKQELWSLFDFVYPGKLGVLPVFKQQIELPIRLGGYSNASNLQVQAAYKCAVVLKEIIGPFILRRFKSDVTVLPGKEDLVLFCNPVQKQKDDYEAFLKSKEVGMIFEGKRDMLAGIDVLRKICNHPDLADRQNLLQKPGYKYGSPSKSGKMQIVKGLLKTWQGNSKCLMFSQGTQMLDILEKLVQSLNIRYLRMDGSTPVGKRQALVDNFNDDSKIMVFLLTTRVGGLGVNLTGASRVIIYDPDWNPSHDIQARERSWRLGQKKDVKIYRLIVRGTIEEKIYQRQLFKQFLSKKVLENPQQRRLFKLEDMHDLFSFGPLDEGTETGHLLSGLEKAVKQDREHQMIQSLPGVDHLEPKYSPNDKMRERLITQLSGYSLTDFPLFSRTGEQPSGPLASGSSRQEASGEAGSLLGGILAQAGVHSIIQHDEVIEGSAQAESIAVREANRIAKAAVMALEESSKATRSFGLGSVTWTGRSGAAGKYLAAGSSGVTTGRATPTPKNLKDGRGRSGPGPLPVSDRFSETRLKEMITLFFHDCEGDPSSKDIANFFNTSFPPNVSTESFRGCLKSLASFDRESGTWHLL